MGRSKPLVHSSAPPRVKVTKHITENSSLKMNTFIKNTKQDKSDAAKMNTMQMDPPGGRRRMGRTTKVQTPESESSSSPVDVESSNDGGIVSGASGAVNAASSECRRSSRKKTIKFDVRDLLNKNRKSHKIQIEARIDSNAPKSGTGPASKEELDSKQKTFIEKSAIFRRFSFSENKQPPRPPPPPVALIKTIQQCVGELEQLPLDRDIDLAAISPIARRLSKTQEILTASMMKPKQVNSLIVTKLESASTSTPTTTRKGGRQKTCTVQSASPTAQFKRRGRPRKGKTITGSSDSTTESSNDSFDGSETAILSSPTTSRLCPDGEAKSDDDSVSIDREISVSPASSTKAIDLKEKTDASAVTLSPSELMEPNMFVGAEEEVFTQGLSSDESTVFLRSSPKEKSNDEISLFGRSDSTETNSSDDSERRRKKIRVSVKRVNLPSALREHVDLLLKSNRSTPDVIEILSSNDDESLQGLKKFGGETSSSLKMEECSQESSKTIQTRGSSKRQTEKPMAMEGDNSNSTTIGSIVEISSDSAATPVEELLARKRGTASPQLRVTPTRRVKNSRRQVNENLLEEQTVQHIPIGSADCIAHKDVQKQVCHQPDAQIGFENNLSDTQSKSFPQHTKRSVQKQAEEVPPLQTHPQELSLIQKAKPKETTAADARDTVRQEADEKNVPRNNATSSPSPRTRSQLEGQIETIEIVESGNKQKDDSRKTPATRSISLRKRKDVGEQKKQIDDGEHDIAYKTVITEETVVQGPQEPTLTKNVTLSEQKTPGNGHKSDTQTVENDEKEAGSSSTDVSVRQRAAGKGQKTSSFTKTRKTSEGKALPLVENIRIDQKSEEIKDKLINSSEVEKDAMIVVDDKKITDSKSSPKNQTELGSKSTPESFQLEEPDETHKKGSSPTSLKNNKKPSQYLTRVYSMDQSSSSSERSDSPKGHHKKKTSDTDKSKEDTSSVCSESSSVESSSSSSTSSSSSSSSSSITTSSTSSSTSSTSSSSLSDDHVRTTRSRRSQQVILDSVERTIKNPAVAQQKQQFTEPDSENSDQSLKRGKVKTTSEFSPKDRAKLVQRRKSLRTSRFLLDEESNETSSESSETTSSIRMTRTARSRVRSEVPLTSKQTSQSAESARSPKGVVDDSSIKAGVSHLIKATTLSKGSSTSSQKQELEEDGVKEGAKVSEDELRLQSRPKRKPGKLVPLKDKSPERVSRDDTSCSFSTMRETRARRKTISSASDLEDKLDHRTRRGGEQKKQIKETEPLSFEEIRRKLREKKSAVKYEQKAKVSEQKKEVGAKTEADGSSLRGASGTVDEKSSKEPEVEENDKVTEISQDPCSEVTNQVERKGSEKAESEESRKAITVGCALGSPKGKVEMKNKGMETLKLANVPKGEMNEQEAKEETEIVGEKGYSGLSSEKPKAACVIHSEGESVKENVEPISTSTSSSTAEASAEANVSQSIESSASCKGEEEDFQKTEEFSNSVTKPAEPSKDDEGIENNQENSRKPLSLPEAKREELMKDSLQEHSQIDSTQNESITENEEKSVNNVSGETADTVVSITTNSTLVSAPQDEATPNRQMEESNETNSEPIADNASEEKSENEGSNEIHQMSQDPEDSQNKKQLSPRKKKKTLQQEPQKSVDDEQKKKKKNGPDEASNEFDCKAASAESSHSDDSQKCDLTKIESKPTPSRQLDSSFIESLEKSLMKPSSAKRLQKKKDKPQPSSMTPKDKEDPKKIKKNQDDQKKAVDSIASPKPKKKQKDLTKAEKKADVDVTSKKRSMTKNKILEAPKPLEPIASKTEASEVEVEGTVPSPVVEESTVPVSIPEVEPLPPKEVPVNPPKPMKSKGETKFYPDEQPIQVPTTGKCSPDSVPKEQSPDFPDPLKDIEKFIEDGVNLLKRGYKLEDNGDSAVNNDNAVKPDETTMLKKCKLDENSDEKNEKTQPEDDNSNSNSEHSTLTSTPSSDIETPNGIRRSHRIKNNSKSAKCLVGRGLVRDRERFSMKDDEKTVYSIDDQKMDLAEVEAKNSKFLKDMEERLSNFRVIRENEYKCERVISKEAKRMLCDCFLTAEEEERGELGCGEDCLNRLLMIECGSDCTVKERCTNRRFTKFLYSPCRVFRTEKKGFGIMADIEILPGEFIMEYVGEVIDGDEFERRRNVYSQDKNKHYYFMALRSDAIIDATAKGNVSRFINHSCDPNAETQKWTVNGELRIGFFSRKNIMPGEEITFDYQYQRYGKEAQKCYCESSNCRGWIGEEPSSEEEEEEEEEIDEEEGETESEEEEDQETVPMPTIAVTGPPTTPEGEQLVAEVPVVGKDVETTELLQVFTQVAVEATKPPTELQVKKKKEKRRQLDRKDDKLKRRETKQFLEDPDIEDEVRFLVKCGLRNQADTLRLSRLIVRAKLLGTRLNLLQILRAGELPCRRLFLDYHGLRLLHGWMSEVIDTRDTEKSMEIRMALLSVLECLPISNKTMLTDSKVYQTVRDWSNNKESHSPSDESPKDTTAPTASSLSPIRSEDSLTELQKLAAKLVSTWDNLPEVFRIPKRERIEQMKEHEREADRQYKGLGEDVSGSDDRRNRDRFIRSGPNSSRFKWSRSDKDKERERTGDRRRYLINGGSGKDGGDKTQGMGDSHLSKEQRRELFAAKVARDEAEKRLAEERREFDIKCRFFGLDPKRLRPENMPFCVNPSTGQWYSTDKKPISTPPSYAHVQVPVKPKSTNPEDYQLPTMDLPPLWKFAISPKGKIYYYHVKIRIPQWEPPIKILPLAGQKNAHVKGSESDSSNAECADSSDDDIDIIKGLDPVKLQAYIEKKIEDRRLQRYNRLVEEKPISPRKEEDRIYNQMEVRKYKENKEKIRKRKEEIRRRRDTTTKVTTSIEPNPPQPEQTAETDEIAVDAIPIQDYLLSSDEEDKIKEECNNSPLIDKIVQGDKIVDELDALQCKRPLKRALPIREKYEHKKRKVDKNKESSKSTKRSKDGESSSSSSSSKYRKIREKFRCEIAGIIVQHLKPYRKETCFSGRILTDDDFNHLARKLTHFVMVKELKYCESIGQTLVVTESVKNKSREFIKKYMAKYGGVYVRPKNDPEFKEIPFL